MHEADSSTDDSAGTAAVGPVSSTGQKKRLKEKGSLHAISEGTKEALTPGKITRSGKEKIKPRGPDVAEGHAVKGAASKVAGKRKYVEVAEVSAAVVVDRTVTKTGKVRRGKKK